MENTELDRLFAKHEKYSKMWFAIFDRNKCSFDYSKLTIWEKKLAIRIDNIAKYYALKIVLLMKKITC